MDENDTKGCSIHSNLATRKNLLKQAEILRINNHNHTIITDYNSILSTLFDSLSLI